jgi:hypothetical protein
MKFTIFLTISIFSYVSTLQISFEGYHAYAISVDEKNVKLVRTIEDAFKGVSYNFHLNSPKITKI